ncbi:hypothetical protein A6R68_02739 [Neotoma lepida]|uniref:K Homology domain-containing protein n=1 Tax=Neotoma lepida TaxID=56216 RepID=A0A1A6GSS1_NEOLE|nr:hypothetical protein A6R68_02739 [Neotoma lepida]
MFSLAPLNSMEYSDEPCDAYEVEQTPQGFRATVSAPSLLYKHIVGKRGDTKKKIEMETKTSISIPKPGQEGEIERQEVNCDISGGKPLEAEMAGIEYMNDDPAAVFCLLLYPFHRLQELVDRVLERFQALGLTVKEWNSVKLHATVMNTLFRKDPNAEGRYNLYTPDGKYIFKERESFDGRNILKKFENFYFGSLKLNSIHISQRFTVDSFGNYASCGQWLIKLNANGPV